MTTAMSSSNCQTMSTTKRTTPPTFAAKLREIRESRGMTLRGLARSSGIDVGALSKIETGIRQAPALESLLRITAALGVPQGSGEFKELLSASIAEREGETTSTSARTAGDALLDLVRSVSAARSDQTAIGDTPLEVPVPVSTLAELIARSNEYAINSGAVAVVVTGGDGAVRRFQMLEGQKSAKQRRR
jgi:transcriptional regulator with XRE-family HTH domain